MAKNEEHIDILFFYFYEREKKHIRVWINRLLTREKKIVVRPSKDNLGSKNISYHQFQI